MKKASWLGLSLVVACSIDENATNTDGGAQDASITDASKSDATDAAFEAATDAGTDVVTNACDGGKTCGAPTDCPAPASVCVARTCADGCCGTTFLDAGTTCNADGGVVCDGTGSCVGCNAPSDCPSPTTLCQTRGCASHTCTLTNAATGTACTDNGGKVCDGAGVCVACNQPSDCTAQTTLCKTSSCSQNTCGATNAATGTACNDNGGKVCDGAGVCVACNLDTDCPAQTTLCRVRSCTNNNTCAVTNAATGTACSDNGGSVCDGSGTCVACNLDTDCPAQTTLCKVRSCTQNTCGVTFAPMGTPCADNGGTTCDGSGTCQ